MKDYKYLSDTLKAHKKAQSSNLSAYSSIEDALIDKDKKVENIKLDRDWDKSAIKRIKLKIKKGGILEVYDWGQDISSWKDVIFVDLPKTKAIRFRDFFELATNLFKKNDYNLPISDVWKELLSNKSDSWILDIVNNKLSKEEKELYEVFYIRSKKEKISNSDMVGYTKKWLDKYFPGHGLKVQLKVVVDI